MSCTSRSHSCWYPDGPEQLLSPTTLTPDEQVLIALIAQLKTAQSHSSMSTKHFGGLMEVSGLFIASGVWGSGALGGAGPFPLHHHRLLASKDGSGPADGRHTQIRAVLVLSDHVSDAAEGSPSILVDGGPHIRSGRFSLTGSAFHNYHDPFAIGGRLHSDGLAVN